MTRIDLKIDLKLTRIDLKIDLPHASCLSDPQNHVSVIIRCKTAKTGVVENTALSWMRSGDQEQLAAVTVGVSSDPFASRTTCVPSVDTSSF